MPNPGRKKLVDLYYQEDKTLQGIADLYGVSRERVRQWMARCDIPRIRNRKSIKAIDPKYKSLEEYFQAVRNGEKESSALLWKFISPLKKRCDECPSTKYLHIHHLKYPALSLKDIQILCCSCHFCKHRKGNGYKIQLEICDKYIKGQNGKELAREYKITFGMIYHILHKWNIEMNPRFNIDIEALKPRDREIRHRYIQGESGLELAKRYKTSFTNIYRILQNGNVKRRSQILAQKMRHDKEGDLTS